MKKTVLGFLIAISVNLASETSGDQSLQFHDAYIRAMPPGQNVTAAFMTVVNQGNLDCLITSATSSNAERIEFHQHQHTDGIMQMRPLAVVGVEAGETVAFVSGGLHIMLFGVDRPLQEGESADLQLRTHACGDYELTLSVKSLLQPAMGQ